MLHIMRHVELLPGFGKGSTSCRAGCDVALVFTAAGVMGTGGLSAVASAFRAFLSSAGVCGATDLVTLDADVRASAAGVCGAGLEGVDLFKAAGVRGAGVLVFSMPADLVLLPLMAAGVIGALVLACAGCAGVVGTTMSASIWWLSDVEDAGAEDFLGVGVWATDDGPLLSQSLASGHGTETKGQVASRLQAIHEGTG